MNAYRNTLRALTALAFSSLVLLPFAAIGQTINIKPPKNKYSVQDDIKLGDQASAEVERQFPLIRDPDASAYIERVGQRLVAAIPPELQQPAFHYRFQWVNASDINAFALPGGPMYINRGMIESARNEGEMAGVMAHELSHVVLRHATAQATKNSSAGNTLRNLGLILGGAVVGGQAGAELGGVFAQSFMLKYSREYESQADMLGAIIMANAGYDPHDLANVFKTIEQQQRGSAPQWLSDHPNPGNRYEAINKEADLLNVAKNPIKRTVDFSRTQEKFRAMPPAQTMAEIQGSGPQGGYGNQGGRGNGNGSGNQGGYGNRGGQSGRGQNGGYGGGNGYPSSAGQYSNQISSPSSSLAAYTGLNWLTVRVPSNWQDHTSGDGVEFAPTGAFGDDGLTHGIMLGRYQAGGGDLSTASESYLDDMLRGNSYLHRRGSFMSTTVAGQRGLVGTAEGISPITGRSEVVTVYTTLLSGGDLFYAVTVVPQDEASAYSSAFHDTLSTIRLSN